MWTYERDGGTRYPVRPGDLWGIGEHLVACGDLETASGNALEMLARTAPIPVKVVYCDIPYNAGMATGYRTKAGVPRPVDFPAFLAALMERTAGIGETFIETAIWSVDAVSMAATAIHGTVEHVWGITYYRRHRAALLHIVWDGEGSRDLDMEGMDDEQTPGHVITATSPGLIVDYCLGRGLTMRAAEVAGIACYGLELSPYRMSAALTSVAALRGDEPRLIERG